MASAIEETNEKGESQTRTGTNEDEVGKSGVQLGKGLSLDYDVHLRLLLC
jgi:hypothetical protein